jgi:hypothetical protein
MTRVHLHHQRLRKLLKQLSANIGGKRLRCFLSLVWSVS